MHKISYVVNSLLLLIGISACSVDMMKEPTPSDDTMLWDIDIIHQAILMSTKSPYDTIQLDIFARNAKGDLIPNDAAVIYRTSSREVTVSSNGVVRAIKKTDGAWVIAELVERNVRYKDSVRIKVVDSLPRMMVSHLMIDTGNSTYPAVVAIPLLWTVPLDRPLDVKVFSDSEELINNVHLRFWVADSSVGTIDPYSGVFRGLTPNAKVWVYAGATVFGRPVLDSVQVKVSSPLLSIIGVTSYYPKGSTTPVFRLSPSEIEIAAGGTVIFQGNGGLFKYNIIFEDSLSVEPGGLEGFPYNELYFGVKGGNINLDPADEPIANARKFNRPGIYRFSSDSVAIDGIIKVK